MLIVRDIVVNYGNIMNVFKLIYEWKVEIEKINVFMCELVFSVELVLFFIR